MQPATNANATLKGFSTTTKYRAIKDVKKAKLTRIATESHVRWIRSIVLVMKLGFSRIRGRIWRPNFWSKVHQIEFVKASNWPSMKGGSVDILGGEEEKWKLKGEEGEREEWRWLFIVVSVLFEFGISDLRRSNGRAKFGDCQIRVPQLQSIGLRK